jgi:hypothetical protein
MSKFVVFDKVSTNQAVRPTNDDSRQYPLAELARRAGYTEAELRTEYSKGNLELTMVARKLKGSKRQVREMEERCRVRKNLPASSSTPEIAVVKACGSSKTERSAKVRAAFNQTIEELKKPLPAISRASSRRHKE